MATIKQIKDSAGTTHDIVDTKNTAGSTNSSSKLYLIGATSQAANPQTYSHDTAYVGTDGCLYSNSKKVITESDTVTTTKDGIMTSEDKTKLDKIQDFYEVSVDLSGYNSETSTLENLNATTNNDNISTLKIGDKIRIKSNSDFPIGAQSINQIRIYAPGFNINYYALGSDGVLINQRIGVLRWSTDDDTSVLNTLHHYYNGLYSYPNKILLKYGGFIDVIIIGIVETLTYPEYICAPLFNNSCGYISTNAVDATNALKVYISTLSTSSSYPLVFTNNVTAGNKSLYTDSVNSLYYNPNSNTLTVPTASATTIKASTIANKTSGSTITFNDAVSLKEWSYVKGIFNFKGTDHDNAGVEITGGSTTTAPTVKIRAKDSSTTNGIVLTGRNDSTAAKIVVYSGTGGTCTITGGNTSISSDERLKDFTKDIDIDFDKLKQIPKKYFTWKHDDEKVLNIGTSAQVVENVYPEIVDENFNEDDETFYKSVDYSKLSIIALAAIDKLNERIIELENKIKELE